ncbi:hypothetical protein NGM10_15010 [Halorussus salilacus]|uniref:HalOD1 output domain-containing protein n=1 Tax=Halorussus salilacus TaxID=2953750 RepID=UPI00209E9007|nr:HalOD1 output domain-containing protein [Halorussus salilacus]USZ68029.1 hypothetical protein NGM10_15010 [Halorussus salilacus]
MSDDTPPLPNGVEIEHDEAAGVYRLRHDWTCDEPMSTVVVVALASVSETDPLELDPLRDVLDPDALDELFSPTRRDADRDSGRVEFSLSDHRVVVDATGHVEIRPRT